MKDQDHLQIVHLVYAAFRDGHPDWMLDCCAEEIHWIYPGSDTLGPVAGEFVGRMGIEAFFELFNADESLRQFEPGEFLHYDDRVIVLGHYRSCIKSSRREYDTDFVHIFTFRDAKIIKFQGFFDTALEAYGTLVFP